MTGTRPDIRDASGRPLRDLRISVTDRCNFRCTYCMPRHIFHSHYRFMPRADILSFEEVTRVAGLFASLGVKKIRITGGEPLLRRDIERLVAMLARIEGIDDISLTTNGSLLTVDKARALRDAGLRRLNVSLDALDDATFHKINDVSFPVARVLDAIDNAAAAGLSPVKVNMVVRAGLNEDDIVPMALRFRGTPHIVRFIEYMDVGSTNGWRMDDVIPAREIVARIHQVRPLRPVDPNYRGEVARRWRYLDGEGEIGIITSVTEPFCGGCGRARLSAGGSLYTCLFATGGHDLRALLRSGMNDSEILDRLRAIWGHRSDRYSQIRGERTTATRSRVEMSHIGG
ncbi:MAG: GTP 3',8-cyclase MoaA [Pseudomonadota bacterium]|nr:GTP 3',8-cyclase MoaA [Pseudomonadota bacterium]